MLSGVKLVDRGEAERRHKEERKREKKERKKHKKVRRDGWLNRRRLRRSLPPLPPPPPSAPLPPLLPPTELQLHLASTGEALQAQAAG